MFARLTRRSPGLIILWCCGLAAPAAAQLPRLPLRAISEHPVAIAARAAATARARVDAELARDYDAMRATVPDPVCDAERLRTDPAYRREYETVVRKTAERRKQLALQFLDRHAEWLGHGAGLYYRAMALRFADEDAIAYQALRHFREREGEHPLTEAVLCEMVDCLLSSQADPPGGEADEKRLGEARRLLAALEKRELTPGAVQRLATFRPRLVESELRAGYHDLVADLEAAAFEQILEPAVPRTRERMLADPAIRKGLRRLADPDEEAYYLDVHGSGSVEARRVFWRVGDPLQSTRQELVGRFYRKHRAALDQGAGLLWKARALRLARDPARAIEAYAAFRAAGPDRREAARAGIEQARLLLGDPDAVEAARRVLEDVGEARDLADDERAALEALRARVGHELARAAALHGLIGRPLPALEAVESDGRTQFRDGARLTGGKPAVLLGFAAWGEPSRRALAALEGARERLAGTRVIGVTRTFGFAWALHPEGERQRPWVGEATGPGLAAADERRQVASLWQAAGAPGPLVCAAPGTAPWLASYPTVVELDDQGRVRRAAAGLAAWEAFLARAAAGD